jgi:hypothetical protein
MLVFVSFYTSDLGIKALHSLNKSAQIYLLSPNRKVRQELERDYKYATNATELISEIAIQTSQINR